ncbi:MAG: uracil phosphoribosyltransferase [Bacteroidales bacterium]|nr:uracil phosphoribosyltransferase [Bacteroidales bacterium]
MIKVLGGNRTLMDQYISELRDAEIQKDGLRFRLNLERASEIFAYEISKQLNYKDKEVITSLGVAEVPVIADNIVIASILRAGIPMHNGMLRYFDHAENAFISAYRKYKKNDEFRIEVEYVSSADLEGKVLILCDPMLATGASMVLCHKELVNFGKPSHTHFVSLLASSEGIEYIKKHLPSENITLWVGAVDDELTAAAYIVPGLGDAGDLAFGKKI